VVAVNLKILGFPEKLSKVPNFEFKHLVLKRHKQSINII
jgi:hypothetical protein